MATAEPELPEAASSGSTTGSTVSEPGAPALSAAARARSERNRLRARALRDARLVQRPPAGAAPAPASALARAPLDSGGGFLLEEGESTAARAAPPPPPPAPLQPPDQPACLACARRFPASYLLDTFDHNVCDACRDENGAHALLTRTEAKTEFLLKDCDLDLRSPALRCVCRPNPHRAARGDMRLYLRAQVEARALLVWGSEAALERERAERGERRARTQRRQDARRLRALRMDVRSSLFARPPAQHEHRWGAETHDAHADTYSHACVDCGHTETYEKM